MEERREIPRQTWGRKFQNAFRGVWLGIRTERSLWVHSVFAIGVVFAAWCRHVQSWQWCTLLSCIVIVFVAEIFNTALERLAKAIATQYDPHVRDALDLASAAVLLAAAGAVTVGLFAFLSAP